MATTEKKAEPAKKAAAKPTGRDGAREVGDRLEKERQERVAAQEAKEALESATHPAKRVWDALAAPFAQDDLERLPRPLRARDDNKGRCEDTPNGRYYSADQHYCNGWHARAVHLDYVGHAGITMRLNDVLGPGGWDFQPYAHQEPGLPVMGRGEFYATLTIRVLDQEPVTKWDLASNYSSLQEAYGDALRRCAMRFGVGTYLWSKSERALALKQATDEPPEPPAEQQAPPVQEDQTRQEASPAQRPLRQSLVALRDTLNALGQDARDDVQNWWSWSALPALVDLDDAQERQVRHYLETRQDPTEAR